MPPIKTSSLVTRGMTTFAIATDGKLYAWGENDYGQVGNGRSGLGEYQTRPYELTSVGKVKSLEISGSTVYAITEEGKLYAWGSGYTSTPQEVTGIVGKVKSIETDGSTAYAITEDGKLYAWGDNEYGQVGNGSSGSDVYQTTPYEVTGIVGKVKSVVFEAIYNTVYAITEEGKLYAWGYNEDGEVGNGSTGTQTTPYEVTSVGKVKSVVTDGDTVYAITEEGKLYAWGDNGYGQVGSGSYKDQTTPYEVTGIVGKVKSLEVDDVDFYRSTVYAITEDNRLYAWGYNNSGQVGNGYTTNQTTPYELTSVGKVKSVEIYSYTVYAITEDGRLYTWGRNWYGQVGNGTTTNQRTPYEVTQVGTVKLVEVDSDDYGSYFTVYAVTEDGKLYAWGYNRYGEVGNGSSGYDANQTTPYELTSIVGKVKSVITNDDATVYAITEDGKLYAWGSNGSGQVGNGSTSTQTIPYELTSIVGKVKSVVTNDNETVYAITEDGRLYGWGSNYKGLVGNGSTEDQTTPYYISEVKQFLE